MLFVFVRFMIRVDFPSVELFLFFIFGLRKEHHQYIFRINYFEIGELISFTET